MAANDLAIRIIALFAILVSSVMGVAMPTFVHRVTTGRWPGGQHRCCDEDDADEAVAAAATESAAFPSRPAASVSKKLTGGACSRHSIEPSECDYTSQGSHDSRERSHHPRSQSEAAAMRRSFVAASSSRVATKASPSGLNYMHVVKLLSALGCGAIIATGLIHIAPGAIESFTNALDAEYPVAMGIATGVVVLLYILEKELTLQLQMAEHRKALIVAEAARSRDIADAVAAAAAAVQGGELASAEPGSATIPTVAPSTHGTKKAKGDAAGSCCHFNRTVTAADGDAAHQSQNEPRSRGGSGQKEDALEVDDCSRSKLIRASVATHVLEIGVAVHSVIIGFALGMITDRDEARGLTIALVFHQFCEGAAVGAAVLESRLTWRHTLLLWCIFALTAPTGVALGIATEQTAGSEQGWRMQLAQGVLESIAFGILMYMSLVDMLPNLFRLPAADDGDDDNSVEDTCVPNATVARHAHHRRHHHEHGIGPAADGSDGGGVAAALLHQPAPPAYGTSPPTVAIPKPGGDEPRPPPGWYRALVYAMLLLGSGVMAVLAVWA